MNIESNFWESGDLLPAFRYSQSIIEHHAKSFSFASKFLPEPKRWGTYAVYNFCRYADNIIDNPRKRSNDELITELNELRRELDTAYKYRESEHPALKAFIATAKVFGIPKSYADDLLNGVEMDLTISEYQTFDELYVFCYRVASTVGLMMTYVLGFEGGQTTLNYAEKLGIAMQLTNILRDVADDTKLGRLYLPKADLIKFGVDTQSIINEDFTPELKIMMKFQVDRALKYYNESQIGISMLDKESRFAIQSASKIYGEILNKIIQNDYNPFLGRVYVTHNRKIQILFSELIGRFVKK
ncbi:MAG: phytoene/squalene synthase family protein [Candidatus Kapabacteria bacterium]|nr:phytoene/squalene synthase family protein [Ignavibacteriota bacterium]MCW5884976.1 phytoene/squalene synthase family protein [Candidatus Kapabacteria bacterium]